MDLKGAMLGMLVISISGCALTPRPTAALIDDNKVRTFADVYRRAKEAGLSVPQEPLRLTTDIGVEKPYVPVYEPPHVIKVWIPAHVALDDKDVMVAGHWAFVVVTPSHWLIEDGESLSDMPPVLPGVPLKI